jgi:hypothetical protein
VEVSQIPGEQLITLASGAAFTWFTCWADSVEGFQRKTIEVMLYYGLHVVGFDEVSVAAARADVGQELGHQIENAMESKTHALYGTFHTYPRRYC